MRNKQTTILTELLHKPVQTNIVGECNFEEFPFTCVSTKNLTRLTEYSYYRTVRNNQTGALMKQEWTIRATASDHLPGPFDADVRRALDKIAFDTGLEQVIETKMITCSIYQIVEILGLKTSGKVYKAVRASLERLKTTTIISRNSFYLKDKKTYVDDIFNLIDRIRFFERVKSESKRSRIEVQFGSYYIESLKAHYIKPFDLGFYLSLQNPIPKRLYSIFDKRCYKKDRVVFDLQELAKAIPIMHKSPSKIKQSILPGIEELHRRGYISAFKFYSERSLAKLEIRQKKDTDISDENEYMVQELIAQLGDPWSRDYYKKLCATVDENLIYRALSEVKEEMLFGEVKTSKGALFTTKIKRYLSETSG